MALNKKMHPRNRYRTPPSFKDLALKNEEFRQHAKIEISGKVFIDFKNADALRALTRALLKEDWGLDVVLPPEYLVPTLPLRLNYILWLEDLVAALQSDNVKSSVYGIDIGTGASCIYPLLAAKKNGWFMIGTEKNEICFNHAKQNVHRNELQSLVKVVRNNGNTIIDASLLDGVFDPEPSTFHITMCNPPFFSSEEEMEKTNKSRSESCPRPPPNNARTGSANEVVVEGGEVAFISKMIDESFILKDRIQIFSTMLGHKKSVSKVLQYLKNRNIHEIASSEFCQGHVTRWGLAWSHTISLTCESQALDQAETKQKPKPPVRHVIPCQNDEAAQSFDSFLGKVKQLMDKLEMQYKCVIKDTKSVGFQVTAHNNTWTNQRRQRREQLRKSTEQPETTACPSQTAVQGTQEPPRKKAKQCEPKPLVVIGLIVSENQTEKGVRSMSLEMTWLEGSARKDVVHQVMQFIKNNI